MDIVWRLVALTPQLAVAEWSEDGGFSWTRVPDQAGVTLTQGVGSPARITIDIVCRGGVVHR